MDDTEFLVEAETPSSTMATAEVPTPPAREDKPPHSPPEAGERSRTVPYGALAEERARRRELQRELQAATATRERLQERLDTLHALAARSDTGLVPPTPGEHTADIIQTDRAIDNTAEVPLAEDVFRTQVLQSVRSYAAERPDFLDAYEHARQARIEELSALGYAQDEALAITFDNEREVIAGALSAGRNPAQVIYEFAVRRGYQPRERAPASLPVSGKAPQTGQTGPAPLTEAEKIALAARGQAGAKSLSAAGGGSTGTLTLEALADMSDEEFAEATKGERWQRLLRG